MQRQVALLRAVNVGGRNKAPMAALRAALASMGLGDVASYLQSGNLLFDAAPAPELEQRIAAVLAEVVGLQTTVMVRTGAQLADTLAGSPFHEVEDATKVHFSFLAGPARLPLPEVAPWAPERFALGEGVVHLHLPAGYGRSKLNNRFWERALGVGVTTRGLRTVRRLVELTR